MKMKEYRIELYLVGLAVLCLTNMLTLKGVIPSQYLISEGLSDFWFAVCSGFFSGILVYFATVTIPSSRRRKRSAKVVRDSIRDYVKYVTRRIDELEFFDRHEEYERGSVIEEMRSRFSEFTYGYCPAGGSDTIYQRLSKIRGKKGVLDNHIRLYYSDLDDEYYDMWKELEGGILFSASRKYVSHVEREIKDDQVEIGGIIADYYWRAKAVSQKLKG